MERRLIPPVMGLKYGSMSSRFSMPDSFAAQLIYVLLMPLFFLGFSLLYNQFDIHGYYSFGNLSYTFHLLMVSCIILGSMLIMRLVLFFLLRKTEFSWWHYTGWCLVEGFVCSAFVALYSVLVKNGGSGYFDILSNCIKFIYLTLCYPYGLLIFIRIIKLREQEIDAQNNVQDNSLIRFYDEHKRLKLTIAPSSILYINSEFNYVKIHYLDAGKVKEYLLRASMKSIEAMKCSHCLVRCQRSYFVNPEHVSVLRKDKEGFIFAQLNMDGVPDVPVSKQYYEALTKLL